MESYITWSSAICGGVFGLLGGWLTDRFGRRAVLTWSILLFAVSALLSGFSNSAMMLLVLRCTTFIGVCVEFVAAVAWLAELFPNPKQRESVLGYTQAFSSFGGMMATGSYLLVEQVPDAAARDHRGAGGVALDPHFRRDPGAAVDLHSAVFTGVAGLVAEAERRDAEATQHRGVVPAGLPADLDRHRAVVCVRLRHGVRRLAADAADGAGPLSVDCQGADVESRAL